MPFGLKVIFPGGQWDSNPTNLFNYEVIKMIHTECKICKRKFITDTNDWDYCPYCGNEITD